MTGWEKCLNKLAAFLKQLEVQMELMVGSLVCVMHSFLFVYKLKYQIVVSSKFLNSSAITRVSITQNGYDRSVN